MAEKKIVIRPATAMDSVNLVRLLKSGYEESAARKIAPFDEQEILRYVSEVINPSNKQMPATYCTVAEKEGRLLGSLALTPRPVPWHPRTWVMMENWFAVAVSNRIKGVDGMLLDQAWDMLDRLNLFAFMGTNMFTSNSVDLAIESAPSMTRGRITFIRQPGPKVTRQ